LPLVFCATISDDNIAAANRTVSGALKARWFIGICQHSELSAANRYALADVSATILIRIFR
jgi:hypothetical protein